MQCFDTIVVGKGLVGSAAAKYLSVTNDSIALIGPGEPVNDDDSIVFASHYDQARVQRIIGKDEVWTRLNESAIRQYPNIEKQTGICFHHPVGCLYVNPYGEDDYLLQARWLSKKFNAPFKSYQNKKEIAVDFSDFNFPPASHGLFETAPAGFIDPRLLIEAQLHLFRERRGTVLKETVIDISYKEACFFIKTAEGSTHEAKKVLLATGSFMNFLGLLPQPLQLKTKSEVVLLAKLSPEEAERLSRLPSLLYEIDNGETEGIYLIQPVKYPDGNFYIKIGCNMPGDIFFDTLEEVQHWFKQADCRAFAGALVHALKMILPGAAFTEYLTKKCIISRTPHGRPFIGQTSQTGLYVAGGCNGYSAMCSDAIGNVAAELMMNDKMPEGYNASMFELMYV